MKAGGGIRWNLECLVLHFINTASYFKLVLGGAGDSPARVRVPRKARTRRASLSRWQGEWPAPQPWPPGNRVAESSWQRNPEPEPHAAAGPRIQQHVGVQGSRAALQTGRAQPQQFEFLQGVGAGKTEPVAVVVHRDLQAVAGLLQIGRA